MFFCTRRHLIVFTVLLLAFVFTKATPVKQVNKTAIATNKNQNAGNLANSYNEILNDVRWFFQRLEDFSTTALNILPNASVSAETRTFSEYTRLNFLIGLRHLFVGVREMSITLRKSIEAEHVRQFQYVIQATNIVQEALKTLKIWLSSLRTFVAQLFRVYSQHLPEVLLGKCLGRYIAVTYPESSFYEYPFLLFNEVFNTILDSINTKQVVVSTVEIEKEEGINEALLQTTTERVSVEQNEIPYETQKSYKSIVKGRAMQSNDDDDFLTSFFNLSDVIDEDKDEVINNAIKNNSWKKCFKMYTAETIILPPLKQLE